MCVSPSMLPLTDDLASLKVATVCGFPSGNHTPVTKAAEAAESSRLGADEIDMVINIGYLKAGEAHRVVEEITAVREATTGLLKVIIESAALTDEEIVTACQAAEEAGADFVKTSTGFHPAGGASTHAVALMAATVDGRLGVKASGGIRDWATAQEMVAAGPPAWGCPPAAPSWRAPRPDLSRWQQATTSAFPSINHLRGQRTKPHPQGKHSH